MGELFEQVFAHHASVQRGPATGQDHAADIAQLRRGHVQAAEFRGAFFDAQPAAHRIADRAGLLKDFLEHVVRVIALLDVLGGELDFADRAIAAFAGQRTDLEFVALDRDEVEVVQVNRVAGVGDDRAHIARQKIFVLPDSEDERAATPRADDEIGNIRMDQRDAVGADDLLQRRAQCFHEQGLVPPRIDHADGRVVVNFPDQMGQHFGVRFGREMVLTLPQKRILDLRIILDHAIVDEGKFTALIEMRMRILIGRLAVGRPTRVTDAVGPGRGRVGHQLREPGDASRALARLDMVTIDDRDAGGIIAAVFEPAQPIEQDGRGFRSTDVSNNATHKLGRKGDTVARRTQGGLDLVPVCGDANEVCSTSSSEHVR